MIIYTILNKKTNKCFAKTFENPYQAESYRKKIFYSKYLRIVRTVHGIL